MIELTIEGIVSSDNLIQCQCCGFVSEPTKGNHSCIDYLRYLVYEYKNQQQAVVSFLDTVVEPNIKGLIADYPKSDIFKQNMLRLEKLRSELI